MAMSEVHVDEARREIEDPPLAGVEPGALGAGDDDLLDAALRRPRAEDVVGGGLVERADAVRRWPDKSVDLVQLPRHVTLAERRPGLEHDVDALGLVVAAKDPPFE